MGRPITTNIANCLPTLSGLHKSRQTKKKYTAWSTHLRVRCTGITLLRRRGLAHFVGILPDGIQRRTEIAPRPTDGANRRLLRLQKVWTPQKNTGGRGPGLVRPNGSLTMVQLLCTRFRQAMHLVVPPEDPMAMALVTMRRWEPRAATSCHTHPPSLVRRHMGSPIRTCLYQHP